MYVRLLGLEEMVLIFTNIYIFFNYYPVCLGNDVSVNVNGVFLFSWHTELRLLLLEIVCLKGESSFFVQMQTRNKNTLKDQENNFCPLERNKSPLFPSMSWCIFTPLSCSLWGKLVMICIMIFEGLFLFMIAQHKGNTEYLKWRCPVHRMLK